MRSYRRPTGNNNRYIYIVILHNSLNVSIIIIQHNFPKKPGFGSGSGHHPAPLEATINQVPAARSRPPRSEQTSKPPDPDHLLPGRRGRASGGDSRREGGRDGAAEIPNKTTFSGGGSRCEGGRDGKRRDPWGDHLLLRRRRRGRASLRGGGSGGNSEIPDRKSTRLNSSHITRSRMPSSA